MLRSMCSYSRMLLDNAFDHPKKWLHTLGFRQDGILHDH